MKSSIDTTKTLEIIQQLKLAKIGDYSKWEIIVKKLTNKEELNSEEISYFSSLSRIYKDANVSRHTKIFHSRLSDEDKKPPCKSCGKESLFYCNMNDAYFCESHVVGHDETEI